MSLKLGSIIVLFVDMAKVMTYIIAYTAIDGKGRVNSSVITTWLSY
jgi:hypothetical protein